jgi:uncharacterized membrane protein
MAHLTGRRLAPSVAVGLLIVAYVAVLGTMALRRHQNLRTNALDLGYTDQAVWNTLHGRPFRFSTYLDAAFYLDIPIQEFREPGVLLGYHVEPLLVPISLLYLLHDGPETLLWLQTLGIALGAVPLYLLARWRFERRITGDTSPIARHVLRWLPVAFVLLYLLAPSLQAANLSDFHAVALSPAFLLAAFYFLETDRPWGFVAFAFLAMMCKEEVGIAVAMVGLWAAVVRRRWILGLGTFAVALGWSYLCFAVIAPYFNGLDYSAFLVRYGQFGESPAGIVRNLLRQPRLLVDWLRQPDVLRYLRELWFSSGGLSILGLPVLVLALPSVSINTFSAYGWMRSGGGHYSAVLVPFLIIASVYGLDWMAARLGRGGRYHVVSALLMGVGLVVALAHHHQAGVSPLSRRFALEPVTEHARRAAPFVEQLNDLPPDVPISASSNLYPHVGHRQWAYLFPTISDAEFILLDATGPGSPAGTGEQRQIVRDLLDYAQFGVAASDHGFLLLQRGLDQYRFSPTFHEVFLSGGEAPQVAVGADFGGQLRLEGFDWDVRPVVRLGLVVEITTYWRVLEPLDDEYRLVFYFWDGDNRLLRVQPEEQALHWYPTSLWEPDQTVKVTLPPLPVGDLPYTGVAVLRSGAGDQEEVGGRLTPIISSEGQPLVLREQDTILELQKP